MPRKMYLHKSSMFKEQHKTAEVATEAELLEFCNKVRAAGQADVLDALLPSQPGDPNPCLIANALNFRSSVLPAGETNAATGFTDKWVMVFPSSVPIVKRHEIATAVGCEIKSFMDNCGIHYSNVMILPEHIGHAADAFDARSAFSKYIK